MRQLTSLDTQFLAMESAATHGHVGLLAILDPSTRPDGRLTAGHIQELLEERIAHLPPFRWRLVDVPLGLDYPYWLDDPDFDLEFHVRGIALPEPGDDAQLAEQVARIFARPLDRSRPLWEIYVIEGLRGGRVAFLGKTHHSMLDGISSGDVLAVLTGDAPPADGNHSPHRGERRPSESEMLVRGLRGVPLTPLRTLRGAAAVLPHLDQTPLRTLPGSSAVAGLSRTVGRIVGRGDGAVLERPPADAPRTFLNGTISPHRRVVTGSVSLTDVKTVKNAFGTTVNDVVVAVCAGALRRMLEDRQALPSKPLVAIMPVSVRTPEQRGTFGNRISFMFAPIATDEPDPLRRLMRVHDILRVTKERHRGTPATLMHDVNHLFPAPIFARSVRATLGMARFERVRPAANVVISNVPGARTPLQIAGARVVSHHPLAQVYDGMGLNFSLFSYLDQLDFGIVADREILDDVTRLMDDLRVSLDELVVAAKRRR